MNTMPDETRQLYEAASRDNLFIFRLASRKDQVLQTTDFALPTPKSCLVGLRRSFARVSLDLLFETGRVPNGTIGFFGGENRNFERKTWKKS
uniref:Uncharacterized protein n=1 Tax=Candidatus Kentrum sp. TUN TaxID=2126343 RepID=A0A450ZM56_9GAMM|nr:MAG: hypothetical protein BECKTUN1418F_GA0071002_10596 [Candidatus Kentron sp. TUN]VFK60164.1 MAG: hypothetical protein BECKTUN1418E_GA0071001_10576 [Candidatus Kentron sp. TUN]